MFLETDMIRPVVYSSPGSTSLPDSSRPLVILNVANIDAATSQRVDCAMWLPGQILVEIMLAEAQERRKWGDGRELSCGTRIDNNAKHEGKNYAPPSEAKRHLGGIQNIGIELPVFEEPIRVELLRFHIFIIVM